MVNSKKSSDSEIFLNWPFLYPGLGHRDPPRPGPQGPGAKRLIFFSNLEFWVSDKGRYSKKPIQFDILYKLFEDGKIPRTTFALSSAKIFSLTWKIVNKKSKIAMKPYFLGSIYDGMGWFWIVSTHWSRILPSRTAKVDIFSDFHGFCHFFDFFFF